MMKECSCPSCGAPVVFKSPASILAVCEYCSSTLVRHDVDLENVGKMAELQADGSPLQLGAAGRYGKVSFTVVGRIQLRYQQGLWNEWHLLFDDQRSGWLGESKGTYAISFLTEVGDKIPRFEDLHPGQRLVLKGQTYEVTNLEKAFCVGGRGELPFQIGPGYAAPSADLTGPGDGFATLDYSEEKPLVFMGEYVEFEELHLSGLRELNGW
ncbi:MAG TPA: DUF4178 domain-containing protein [Thermodesulfobacteriota bacterium]|nr:DUF4178 domain-containing protein [Thermodesulfobacteriota bacterium]